MSRLPSADTAGIEILPSVRPTVPEFQKCAACSHDLLPDAKFCGECGRPVELKPEPRKCPKCGAENMPGSTFCNQCGERIA